jgi:predicted anti-sigma-YlaC factor YlaD
MNCEQVRQLQSNYIDEELIEQVRSRIDEHLAVCDACREDYEAVAQAVDRLHAAAPSEDVAPWFAERALERLERENDVSDPFAGDQAESQLSFQDL